MATNPQIPAALRGLATDSGVVLEYLDATGVRRCADPEVLLAVLNGLGVPIGRTSDAARLLRSRRSARVERIVEPVIVLDDASIGEIPVSLREADTDLECAIESEEGERVEWRVHRDDLVSLSSERLDGRDIYRGAVPLPALLQSGYRRFTVRVRGRVGTATRRRRAGSRRPGTLQRGLARLWDLRAARSRCTRRAAGDRATSATWTSSPALPPGSTRAWSRRFLLLAGFGPEPFEASPYLPVSRRFWHERWIDVERVPEFAWSPAARVIGSGPQASERRASWVKGAIVDGAAVTAAKRAALSAMATAVGRSATGRETALRNFMFERPDLVEYARFRAAADRFGIDWHTWPGPLRSGLLRWSDVDPVNERYHVYAQWVAHEQMAELSERLSQRGQVLALDLPVGIHPCGYDVWRHREQYAISMSVGAPPDGFFAQGQSWGFPPTRPRRSGTTVTRSSAPRWRTTCVWPGCCASIT